MARIDTLRLAALQDGLITRSQALATGLTASALRYSARPGGRWQRLLPGIYATFSGPLQDIHKLRAAVLAAGEGSMVTGPRACRAVGLRYGPDPGEWVDALIGWRHDRGNIGFVRVTRTKRLPEPLWWIDEHRLEELRHGERPLSVVMEQLGHVPVPGVIPMAPAARAVVDTIVRPHRLPGGWQPGCTSPAGCPDCRDDGHRAGALRNVRALMCEVVQRRLTSVSALRDEVAAAPRRGAALARQAMRDVEAGCRSAPECELRDLVRTSRVLPEPRWNRVLPGQRGIYPDACWRDARLVAEVDSRSYHGFGDAPRRTEERRARYAALGWRVLPVAPARLRTEPHVVLGELEAAYLARGA